MWHKQRCTVMALCLLVGCGSTVTTIQEPIDGIDGGAGHDGDTGSEDGDNGSEDGDTGSEDGDTGSEDGDNGSEDGDTGSEDGDTGSEDGDTGSEDGDTGSEDGDTGSEDGDTGSEDGDTGSEDGDTGSEDGDTGSEDGDTGSEDGDTGEGEWRESRLTYYTSYPEPGSDECEDFSGCDYAGYFAAFSEQKSEDWVASHNIAAVHEDDYDQYVFHTLRIRYEGHTIDAVVYDMCRDSDCDGCCTRNKQETGFLIDLESYTADRFGVHDADSVEWTCIDC